MLKRHAYSIITRTLLCLCVVSNNIPLLAANDKPRGIPVPWLSTDALASAAVAGATQPITGWEEEKSGVISSITRDPPVSAPKVLIKLWGRDRKHFDFPETLTSVPGSNLLDWLQAGIRRVADAQGLDAGELINIFGSLGYDQRWADIHDIDIRVYFRRPMRVSSVSWMMEEMQAKLTQALMDLAPAYGLRLERETDPAHTQKVFYLQTKRATFLPVMILPFAFNDLNEDFIWRGALFDPMSTYYVSEDAAATLLEHVEFALLHSKEVLQRLYNLYEQIMMNMMDAVGSANPHAFKELATLKAFFRIAGVELRGPSRQALRKRAERDEKPRNLIREQFLSEAEVPLWKPTMARYDNAFLRLVVRALTFMKDKLVRLLEQALQIKPTGTVIHGGRIIVLDIHPARPGHVSSVAQKQRLASPQDTHTVFASARDVEEWKSRLHAETMSANEHGLPDRSWVATFSSEPHLSVILTGGRWGLSHYDAFIGLLQELQLSGWSGSADMFFPRAYITGMTHLSESAVIGAYAYAAHRNFGLSCEAYKDQERVELLITNGAANISLHIIDEIPVKAHAFGEAVHGKPKWHELSPEDSRSFSLDGDLYRALRDTASSLRTQLLLYETDRLAKFFCLLGDGAATLRPLSWSHADLSLVLTCWFRSLEAQSGIKHDPNKNLLLGTVHAMLAYEMHLKRPVLLISLLFRNGMNYWSLSKHGQHVVKQWRRYAFRVLERAADALGIDIYMVGERYLFEVPQIKAKIFSEQGVAEAIRQMHARPSNVYQEERHQVLLWPKDMVEAPFWIRRARGAA